MSLDGRTTKPATTSHDSPDIRFEIRRGEPGYPPHLSVLPEAPETLYCIGEPALLAEEGLAVIGSRRATPYGLGAARMFATYAAGRGVPIISGGAIGCDQEAHRAALAVGGPTVAVLGCGADVDYPRGAAELLDAIRRDGLVVSEVGWGTCPQRYLFARRNRIIAGLSRAVLVVEAALPSGTFGTADRALDYGRDLYVVPGSIYSPESRGANRLLCQGAHPVTDVSELSDALGLVPPGRPAILEPDDDPLLAALRADPQRPDDVARSLNLHIVEVSRRIGWLELAGQVVKYPDGRYGPCVTMKQALQSSNANRTDSAS